MTQEVGTTKEDIELLDRYSAQADYNMLFGKNYSFFESTEEFEQVHGTSRIINTTPVEKATLAGIAIAIALTIL